MLNRILLVFLGLVLGVKVMYWVNPPPMPQCSSYPLQQRYMLEPEIFLPPPAMFWAL